MMLAVIAHIRAHQQVRPHQKALPAFAHARLRVHGRVDLRQGNLQNRRALHISLMAVYRHHDESRRNAAQKSNCLHVGIGYLALNRLGKGAAKIAVLERSGLEILPPQGAPGIGKQHPAVIVRKHGVLETKHIHIWRKGRADIFVIAEKIRVRKIIVHAQHTQSVIHLLDRAVDRGLLEPFRSQVLHGLVLAVANGKELGLGLLPQAVRRGVHAIDAHDQQGHEPRHHAENHHFELQGHGEFQEHGAHLRRIGFGGPGPGQRRKGDPLYAKAPQPCYKAVPNRRILRQEPLHSKRLRDRAQRGNPLDALAAQNKTAPCRSRGLSNNLCAGSYFPLASGQISSTRSTS